MALSPISNGSELWTLGEPHQSVGQTKLWMEVVQSETGALKLPGHLLVASLGRIRWGAARNGGRADTKEIRETPRMPGLRNAQENRATAQTHEHWGKNREEPQNVETSGRSLRLCAGLQNGPGGARFGRSFRRDRDGKPLGDGKLSFSSGNSRSAIPIH